MWDFLGGLLGGLGGVGADVWQAIQWLASMIVQGLQFLWSVLVTVANFFWSLFQKLGHFLSHLWNNFFKRIFTGTLHWMGQAFNFIRKYAQLVMKYIHRVQQFLDRYYKQYIRPQLIMMQRIRQVLGVFRLLHIHTFDKLDKYLQHAESQLIETFLFIRGYVNLVAGFVNQLASPLGILKLVLFGAAGPRQSAAMVRILTGLPIGWFFPNYHKNALPWEKPVTSSKQLLDPSTNPTPSQLLGPVQFQDVGSSFTDASPIPTDAELDSAAPGYMYDDALGFLEASEAALALDSGDPLSIIDMIATRAGLLADAGAGGARSILGLVSGS